MTVKIFCGDSLSVLKTLPSQSVQMCVTSPPYYGLRDYGTATWEGGDPECDHLAGPLASPKSGLAGYTGEHVKLAVGGMPFRDVCGKCGARRIDQQIGLESSVDEYVAKMVEVFSEVRRVLRDDGVLWLNLGDSYTSGGRDSHGNRVGHKQQTNRGMNGTNDPLRIPNPAGLKPKDLIGIPWRVAFALQADGWYLRSDIVWCLSGGTRVYAKTQKGEMPMTIKDLVRLNPATVKLWNGEKWTQVLGWGENPRPKRPIEIVLRSGERITCTPDHLWPTKRGIWRADEIQVGDVIQTTTLPEPQTPREPSALDADAVGWFVGLYLAEGSRSKETIQIAGHTKETARFERLCTIAEAFGGSCRLHQTSENGVSVNLHGKVLNALVDTYIGGKTAKDKHLKVACWQRSNRFLRAMLDGYLSGDGGYDVQNDRWRIGFTRNYSLAADLRTLCARLGVKLSLQPCVATSNGKSFPSFRGEIRFNHSTHHNTKNGGEIVELRAGRARKFWDIAVEDEPHLFALASGVLTHNCKPNAMPESVRDRPTKAHEYLFLLSKQERYYYDHEAIKEPVKADTLPRYARGRSDDHEYADGGPGNQTLARSLAHPTDRKSRSGNKERKPRPDAPASHGGAQAGSIPWEGTMRNRRTVWTVPSQPCKEAHFATYPKKLIEPCILAGSRPGDVVLDPFFGAGTTGLVALEHGRRCLGVELNPDYIEIAKRRLDKIMRDYSMEAAE